MSVVCRRISVRLLPAAIASCATLLAATAPVSSVSLSKYGDLPLSFERNVGQAPRSVHYRARNGSNYTLMLEQSRAVMVLRHKKTHSADVLEVRPLGAAKVIPQAEEPLPGVTNYIVGNDPKSWLTGIPNYGRIRYSNVYPGIDWVYYGNQRTLEYDFVVQPGADATQIRLKIDGAKGLQLDSATGDLMVATKNGVVRQQKPVLYQMAGDRRQSVDGGYIVNRNDEVAFRVGRYDRTKPLVIDPVLKYWTYVGGTAIDGANSIAVDSAGNAYITGYTNSTSGFPLVSPAQAALAGTANDAFVTKINAAGTQFVYSTYLGGSGEDNAQSIAVDSAGQAYIAGQTSSSNFPIVSPLRATYGGGAADGFLVRLNAAGTGLSYSTFLGGPQSDTAYAVAVDAASSMYVTGGTDSFTNFTGLTGTYSGNRDAFLIKILASGAVAFGVYVGGTGGDEAYSIAVDPNLNAYVTGTTQSVGVAGAVGAYAGFGDAFVAKYNSGGTRLYWAYYGGTGADYGNGIAADANGNAYIAGSTTSTTFPLVNTFQTAYGGGPADGFVAKIGPTGAAAWATYLGGADKDEAFSIALIGDSAVVAGSTLSTNFPLQDSAKAASADLDAFVTRFASAGNTLVYSSRVGGSGADAALGIAVDGTGSAYIAGYTISPNMPSSVPGRTLQGPLDAFIAKLGPGAGGAVTADKTTLNFGIFGTYRTGAQEVRLNAAAGVSWSATPSQPYIQVTPGTGTGSGTIQVSLAPTATAGSPGGTVTISSGGTVAQTIAVNIRAASGAVPFGVLDTPANGATNLYGAIGVTGWALDDVEVSKVDIWRDPVPGEAPGWNGLIYIGDALFIEGSRPDVAGLNPTLPRNTRAGWGLPVLTNYLPNAAGTGPRGNGTYRLHAYARDPEGHATRLGTVQITVNNAGATKPFGTIDTPGNGETISGGSYIVWGWALTPQPGMIPRNGSTIQVWIDGTYFGNLAAYNLPRSDIDSLFPGYANSGGAVGYYVLDTTRLPNGIHTIAWSVTDNLGRTEGLGSRFFWVLNSGGAASSAPVRTASKQAPEKAAAREGVLYRTGYDRQASLQAIEPDDEGALVLQVAQGERLEVQLPEGAATAAFDELGNLPAGSVFDSESRTFSWQIDPVFLSTYTLTFRNVDGEVVSRVQVRVVPKHGLARE